MRYGNLLAATALALGALPFAGPPAVSAAPATPDRALVAQVEAAWRNGMRDAWGREGGTYDERCTWPGTESPRTRTHIALDVTTGRFAQRYTVGRGALPSASIDIGRTEYRRTPGEVRQALRVHGVRAVPWTSRAISAHRAEHRYFLATHRNRGAIHPAWFEWLTLAARTGADGTRTYTGTYRIEVGSHGSTHFYYRPSVEIRVDPQGRPTYWRASGVYEQDPDLDLGPTSVLTCTQTWDWTRPTVTAPRTVDALRPVVRGETAARNDAQGMAQAANEEHLGSTAAVVRWLQQRFGGTQYATSPTARGLLLHRSAGGHQLDWKVVVRHGRADYRPVR